MRIQTFHYSGSITVSVTVVTSTLVKGSCFPRAYGSVNDAWSFVRFVARVFLACAYVEQDMVVSSFRHRLAGIIVLQLTSSFERFPNSNV